MKPSLFYPIIYVTLTLAISSGIVCNVGSQYTPHTNLETLRSIFGFLNKHVLALMMRVFQTVETWIILALRSLTMAHTLFTQLILSSI